MNQEKQKVKICSAEFRESSVKLAIDSDLPIAQTTRDLEINPNTLHKCSGHPTKSGRADFFGGHDKNDCMAVLNGTKIVIFYF